MMVARGSVITALGDLEASWNGHGAEPVAEPALNVVRNLQVFPTNSGGVQIEWHVNGEDAEIGISPAGTVEFFSIDRDPAPPPRSATIPEVVEAVLGLPGPAKTDPSAVAYEVRKWCEFIEQAGFRMVRSPAPKGGSPSETDRLAP